MFEHALLHPLGLMDLTSRPILSRGLGIARSWAIAQPHGERIALDNYCSGPTPLGTVVRQQHF
jgi:hypothetical protein